MNKCTLAAVVAFLNVGIFSDQANANHRNYEIVSGFYQQYLGRPADPAGLQSWVCHLNQGRSPVWVEAQILGCNEYYARSGGCHDSFVRGLFRDVLGEPNPCPTQVSFWCDRLRRCRFDRCELAASFLRYPHRRPGPAVDVQIFSAPPPPPVHIQSFAPPRPLPYFGGPSYGFQPNGCSGGFQPRLRVPHHH